MPKKEKFARDITIYEADNGYLFQVGCSFFVCEGDSSNFCDDLQAYLDHNPEIVKKYVIESYTTSMAFKEIMADFPAVEGKELCEKSDLESTAYAFLTSKAFHRAVLVKSVYEVTNGTVTLCHKTRTATVKQNEV